jgi:FixJ family two-component response regulator
MPRRCSVCTHRERPLIEQEFVASQPVRRIAARYGLSEQAVRRHRAAHVPPALARAHAAEEAAPEVAGADAPAAFPAFFADLQYRC